MSLESGRSAFRFAGAAILVLVLGGAALWGSFELRTLGERVAAVERALGGSGREAGIAGASDVEGGAGFEARVREYLFDHPEVLREALDPRRVGLLAFRKHGDRLVGEGGFPVLVGSDGDGETLVLVEFFDYRCGYCRRFFPAVDQALERAARGEGPNLRFVAVELPILGPDSERAARLALAVRALDSERYAWVHSDLMGEQGPEDYSEDGLREWAEGREWGAGLDLDELFGSGLASPAVDEALAEGRAWAGEIGVTGTPFFGVRGPGGWAFDPEAAASPESFARLLERVSAPDGSAGG